MKTTARTFPHAESGTALHMICDKKTKGVYLCVWESKAGDYISLSYEWMKERMDANRDPIPELLQIYGEDSRQ